MKQSRKLSTMLLLGGIFLSAAVYATAAHATTPLPPTPPAPPVLPHNPPMPPRPPQPCFPACYATDQEYADTCGQFQTPSTCAEEYENYGCIWMCR